MPDTRCRMPDARCRMPDAGRRVPDAGCQKPDAGYGKRETGNRKRNGRPPRRSDAMRTERDSMGEIQVPDDAYYGASTQRAVENFPISNLRFGRRLIAALGMIKGAAADPHR